jgi:nucleotide-binding universal stress UspA family protein
MFKHLLVPLDGSRLAESALPAAGFLAGRLGASVTLIHIVERDAPQEVHGERHLTSSDEACAYLEAAAKHLQEHALGVNLTVERHVHTAEIKDVAKGIVEHVEELAPDLIVMCTHGSGGLREVLFGSIAQQVVARGVTPVVLIRPSEDEVVESFSCRRLLVPLDGSPEHERSLSAAAELGYACPAELHLVFVVPTLGTLAGQQAATGRLLPGATAAMLDMAQRDAEAYLRKQMAGLRDRGLTVTAELERGDPATGIVASARRVDSDMIVLGTHGRTGTDAFWTGSTAAKVLSRSNCPLLLVPVDA